jgi:hypothetical protein
MNKAHDLDPKTPVSHGEAMQIAHRYINMQFNNEGERPRASIPINLERDDDVLLMAYIRQNIRLSAALEAAEARAVEAERENREHMENAAWALYQLAAAREALSTIKSRVNYARGRYHDATLWDGEDGPADQSQSLYDWIFAEVDAAISYVPAPPQKGQSDE